MHTGVRAMQENMVDRGRLQIQVRTEIQNRPIAGARVSISYTGAPGEPLEEVQTDANGLTEILDLPTPPLEYSLEPSEYQPYSEFNLNIQAPGYEPVEISGSELLSGETSVQDVMMNERSLAITNEAVAKWPMEVNKKKIVLGQPQSDAA